MTFILLSMLITYDHTTDIKHLDFNKQELLFLPADGYTKIRILGCEITNEIGAPEVPVKAVKVALPYGARNIGVEIIAVETEILDGEYLISCAQPPMILSQREVTKFVAPNEAIYGSDQLYPESPVQLSGVGTYDNHQLCELLIYPLQYEPRSRTIKYHRSITFRITYEDGIKSEATGNNLGKMVINPEELSRVEKRPTRSDVTYMIISNPPLDTVFQRLSDWKTKKGIPSQVRTVDWIVANYTGEDNAARIRNYIQTLPDSNIQYVLLGGDTYMIPCRFAYAMTCSAYIWNREDSLPCDLYYADLQGNWNFDGDGLYGEIEDSIDLYPDLLVGRAPVSSVLQAQSFVNKILTYEKSPPLDYLDNVLFLAEVLWTSPYTDQAVHKNRIEAEILPSYMSVTKLYETLGNENRLAVMSAIRNGQSLINHDGHGSTTLMGVGNGYLNYSDLDTITNAPQYGIIYTIGCWTAAFDFACIGEAFVKNSNGGGVAFIGNSSYGWGSPGNPGYGYSDIFDTRFFYSLLVENNYHIGEALAMCKTHFIPYSREKNVYRWHQYQLNLLGDPEMMVWTALPESITVAAPQSIPLGSSAILFTIKDKSSGVPISNALVCLMKGSESYAAGYTDETGQIFLEANAGTMGDFELTVTAHNHIPLETVIPVVSGSYVNYRGWILNDTSGNADGIANPNESILPCLMLRNDGNAVATNINMRLRSGDPYVTVIDSIEYLSTLNPGDSTLINDAFDISVGNADDGHIICFQLEITETSRILSYYPSIMVGTPILEIAEFYDIQRPTMPGDTASIYLEIANRGHGYAHMPSIIPYSNDPYALIVTDSITAPDIPPETTHTVGPFDVAISASCPLGHHPQLSFSMSTESYVFGQDIMLVIGATGFADDIESGSGLWTTGGSNNQWHISERRAFSPTHAWYCGQESNGLYVNNMNCYIQTIPFMVDHNSMLRFKRWFQVPIYGSDGIYVIIMHGSGSDTLDFIGTGGALGGRDIQSDWHEQEYFLGQYSGGDTIQIRIAFISDDDGDVAEGFYIDDLNIITTTYIEEYGNASTYPLAIDVQPNPFRNTTQIRYTIRDPGYVEDKNRNSNFEMRKQTLKIYDAAGRMVRDFRITPDALRSTLSWDGCDDLGRSVAPGVYFAILATDNYALSTKIVCVR